MISVMNAWKIRNIKANLATHSIPVIALIAQAMFDDREKAL